MQKVRVRITESFAVLGDPRPKEELDQKYAKITQEMKARRKPPSEATIRETINALKERDRYGEKGYGIRRDRGFRPGEEVLLDADVAQKWEADDRCMILEDQKPSKAS